jgi:phenylacetate-coenzyme A ligase PaaK-like adenylate-forming protein
VHEDLHLVEILHPETLEPVPEGQPGKILLTNLQRRLMPTIRYDIGDEGRWVPGRCACGRKTRLMELMGRCDDMLRVGGGPVSPESVAGAVSCVPGLSGHIQMVVRVSGHLDQLLVRAEVKPGAEVDPAAASTAVRAKLYELSKELKAWREKGLIAETAVEILPCGALPRNPRTGKIRLTVDERH